MDFQIDTWVDCLGYIEAGVIKLNLNLMWKRAKKNESQFIRELAEAILHENLHKLIGETVYEMNYLGEERTVRKLTGEKFGKQALKYYLSEKGKLGENGPDTRPSDGADPSLHAESSRYWSRRNLFG